MTRWPMSGGAWLAWRWRRYQKPRTMKSRKPQRKTVIQFAKYLAGGSVYFWSGYAVFAVCYSVFKWSWLPAKIAADVVGWTLNYLVQRYWAFASDRLKLSEMQHVG